MRVFTTLCKDAITGFQMILSECSYNMAMDWLEHKCIKNGCEFSTVQQYYVKGRMLPAVTVYNKDRTIRVFVYDEERGYLLGE